MKGYGQFCPVAVASEIVAERWTPLILRELLAGAKRFNDIRQGIPLISRTPLAHRLRQLEDAGVVETKALPAGPGREYGLTAADQFAPENLDVSLLMWNMRRRIDVTRLPAERVVVRFEYRGVPARCRSLRTCWLVLDGAGADVCITDPGFAVDLVVHADVATMARVWTGHLSFAHAVRSGGLRLDGPRALVRAFPDWLLLSHFAHVPRPASAG